MTAKILALTALIFLGSPWTKDADKPVPVNYIENKAIIEAETAEYKENHFRDVTKMIEAEPVSNSDMFGVSEQLTDGWSEADVEMLACVIYQEAGADYIADNTRYMVGDVVLNRVADPRFPDALEDVLTQKGQYGRFYWTGIIWPERADSPNEACAVQRAYDTARALLSGDHSELYGAGYVWQAEFKQGTDIIYADGIYFGR